MLSHIRGKINWQNIKLTQIFSSKGGGNSENVRCAVPASAQGIFSSGIKYMMSITATGNKYRFSTLRTSNTPDVTLSSKVLRGSVSSLPHHVTTLPLQKPSSLCVTYPGSAPQKFSSISIFNPPCATRDLVDSVSVLSSVLRRSVSSLPHHVTTLPLQKPSSLCATYPGSAPQKFSSISIFNPPCAPSDLVNSVSVLSSVLRRSVSFLPHHVTTLPLQKPSSLCATYPDSAPQKFSSISIFNPPCAPRDLVDSVSVLSSVLCKIVMLLGHPVLIISFKEHNNTITRSCKAAR